MSDYKEFARELLSLAGLSGYEKPVRESIKNKWSPLVEDIWVSPLGSLHAIKRGTGSEPRKKLLVATHMDAVGMMVTKVDGEYIRFTSVGGLDPRVLPFQEVIVHGRELIAGMIGMPSDRHLPEQWQGKAVPMDHLFIDTGLGADRVKSLVRPGDLVSFANLPLELDGETLMGHTQDDRAAIVAMTICLELLQSRKHGWDLVAAATVQEEVGLKGAKTSGFAEMPDLAIAIDVGFAKEPGASGYFLLDPGSGPALGWGPVTNPMLYRMVESVANKNGIPFSKEINPAGRTGTDADALSLVGMGIPTLVMSVPLRFMHSPVEIVRYEDMYHTGRLIAELMTALDDESMGSIRWDDENIQEKA